MSDQSTPLDEFVGLLAKHQSQLMGYILASLGDYANASDVLQQTNIVLWQKAHELRTSDEFLPWAFTVAKYKILSFVRDKKRDRLIFSPEVTSLMVEMAFEDLNEGFSDRQLALRECLGSLPEKKLQFLQRRYTRNEPLKKIALSMESSVEAIKGRLKRIRKSLGKCIDRRITYWAEN